ncbi:Hypothetical protein NTJ_08121 [Nesidiocoris tenuis]|uniref:Uncharacterized protein n=1 Tax=Nesidiocoris tenuis TaxID=355587 RepID=A0ABN7AV96_9HEMI|nr:Hypothetical protein NTJ_08121 [Nesidiocoris tenuis]
MTTRKGKVEAGKRSEVAKKGPRKSGDKSATLSRWGWGGDNRCQAPSLPSSLSDPHRGPEGLAASRRVRGRGADSPARSHSFICRPPLIL